MAMDKMAGVMESKTAKKFKPVVSIGVDVDTRDSGPSYSGGHDWRKEEHNRLTAEVSALEKELKGFNATEAAEKVKRSIEIKLKLKKLRLEECKLKLDGKMNGISESY